MGGDGWGWFVDGGSPVASPKYKSHAAEDTLLLGQSVSKTRRLHKDSSSPSLRAANSHKLLRNHSSRSRSQITERSNSGNSINQYYMTKGSSNNENGKTTSTSTSTTTAGTTTAATITSNITTIRTRTTSKSEDVNTKHRLYDAALNPLSASTSSSSIEPPSLDRHNSLLDLWSKNLRVHSHVNVAAWENNSSIEEDKEKINQPLHDRVHSFSFDFEM
jgi:hypothetical protein